MKTIAMVTMSAFLMSAAVPVFAMTRQEKLACTWTAGNCLDEAKTLRNKITEIRKEIGSNANGSPEVAKKLEKKLLDAVDELKRVEGQT